MINPEEEDLGDLIARADRVANELATADVNAIFRHAHRRPGAPVARIESFQRQTGLLLPAPYKEFLQAADGWPAFYQEVDLCSLNDLSGSELIDRSWMLVDAADEGSGGMLEISRTMHLPIGVSRAGIDVFLLLLGTPEGAVSWIAGGEVDRFASFKRFLSTMVTHNEATVSHLQGDPWLGITGA